jgi:membrane-bound metal-dependent hydrolase YbcI (DUF457 family)
LAPIGLAIGTAVGCLCWLVLKHTSEHRGFHPVLVAVSVTGVLVAALLILWLAIRWGSPKVGNELVIAAAALLLPAVVIAAISGYLSVPKATRRGATPA